MILHDRVVQQSTSPFSENFMGNVSFWVPFPHCHVNGVASASPRRQQLLAQMVLSVKRNTTDDKGFTDIEVVPSGFEENLDKMSLGPFDYVIQTGIPSPSPFNPVATRKALDVYEKLVVPLPGPHKLY
jgi:hypothetical protein